MPISVNKISAEYAWGMYPVPGDDSDHVTTTLIADTELCKHPLARHEPSSVRSLLLDSCL